jgi:tetratricopeptide (TPR) repeat protein
VIGALHKVVRRNLPPVWLMVLGVLCPFLQSPRLLQAQIPNGAGNNANRMGDIQINVGDPNKRIVLLTVLNQAKAQLDRQALIKLHDTKRDVTVFQTTDGESHSTFYDLDFGDYDVEVSAVGYLTTHKLLRVMGTIDTIKLDVELEKDPNAIDLKADDDAIPAKQRKEAKRVVYDLNSGKLKDAEPRLTKLLQAAPASAQINFLLGYLYMQQKDYPKSEIYLAQAAKLDPRRSQTLLTLGRVQLQRQEYEAARKTLEQAVGDNSDSWMAHNLLADAYLRVKEYDKAREQAQLALDQGKEAASIAELVLGQSLADLGRDQEGLAALRTFLQKNPNNPTSPQVRVLITHIEQRDADVPEVGEVKDADLALSASRPSLPATAWGPPGVDLVKPVVAADVACPYEKVLQMSGERVKQLVDNVAQFAATEDLVHEQLDEFGNAISKDTRKFDYVASISEPRPGYLAVDEYRNEHYGLYDLPDHVVTRGFVALALIFHPDMRDNFQMTCEGLGQWQGQATWLMHFRQRDDKPSRIQSYVVGTESYPIKLKGRAWIAADTFQIVRIESDLVNPVPQLSVQHQEVEYGPIHFKKQNVDLWLPKSVDLYLGLNRHRYYRRHSFDHYMLFAVDAQDKPQMTDNGSRTVQNP